MAAYVVMEKRTERGGEPHSVAFVRDGFHWLAFLVPVPWLLWHRLWIEAVLAFAATLLLSALGEAAGLGIAASALTLLVSFYFGLEGPALRIRALARRGWREWGVLEGSRLADVELIYATAEEMELDGDPASASPPLPVLPEGPALYQPSPPRGIGLVPYPGRA